MKAFHYVLSINLTSVHTLIWIVCANVHVGDLPKMIKTGNVTGSHKSTEHTRRRGCVDHILPAVEKIQQPNGQGFKL